MRAKSRGASTPSPYARLARKTRAIAHEVSAEAAPITVAHESQVFFACLKEMQV